jgi:tetratricopeptide (TPR) repeat protein
LQLDSPKVYAFLKKICEVNDAALVEIPKNEQDPASRHGAAIANYFLALAIASHEGGAHPEPILERYTRSIELLTALVDEDPMCTKYRYNLSRSLSLRSNFYFEISRFEPALADASESLKVAESLARDFHENPDNQDLVANKTLTVAQAYELLGKREEAIASAQAALRLAEELVRKYPAHQYPEKAFYKTNVFRALKRLTDIWLTEIRFDQAWETEQKAAVVNEELIVELPTDHFHKMEQINTQERLANIRFKLGDLPGAEAWLTRAEATAERLAKLFARDESLMVSLDGHHLNIESQRADIYLAAGQEIQAREAYVRMIKRLEDALIKYPERTRWRDSLIGLYTSCPILDLRNPGRAGELRDQK